MKGVIKINKLMLNLLFILIIAVSLPYIGYWKKSIDLGYESIGGLNMLQLEGGLEQVISFLKDVIAIFMFIILLLTSKKENYKFFMNAFYVFLYGIIGLLFSNRISFGFILAGFRTYLYFVVVFAWGLKYSKLLQESNNLKKLLRIIKLTILIQTFITLAQVVLSSSINRFGTGGYRFSGAFAGCGNLGCYTVACCLLLIIFKSKYKNISTLGFMVYGIMLLFLAIASGTRTCIILDLILLFLEMSYLIGKKIRFNSKLIVVIGGILFLIFAPKLVESIVSWTGRGELMLSGSGRIRVFLDMLNSSSIFELIFGKGLGVGTNASVTMNLKGTSVADSTINLFFIQFGIVGLVFFFFVILMTIYNLLQKSNDNKRIVMCFSITILVMSIVGNIFEHIAMCVLLVIAYFLIIETECEMVATKKGD